MDESYLAISKDGGLAFSCPQSRLTSQKTLVRIPARVRSSGLPLGAKADPEIAFRAYVKAQQCELCLIRGYLTQIRLLFLNRLLQGISEDGKVNCFRLHLGQIRCPM